MNNYVFITEEEFSKYQKGGKTKSRVNEAGNYTKPGMRKRLFQQIKAGSKGGRPGQWSARKAQMLAKRYKEKGGGYKQDGGYAETPFERKYGLLAGKNKFKFPVRANQSMTMNPGGMPIDFPVYYQGLVKGVKSDEGIAMPGEDFSVYGDEVREYPMYRKGGISKAQLGLSLNPQEEPLSRESFTDFTSGIRNIATPLGSYAKEDFVDENELQSQISSSKYVQPKIGSYNPSDYKIKSYDVPTASLAYNVSRFLEGPDQVATRTNPYESKVLSGLRATRVRPDYRPQMLAQNALMNKIRSSSSSVPQMMANMQSATGNLQRKMAEQAMQAANTNVGLDSRYYNTMRTMGDARAREYSRVDDRRDRNRAAQMQFLAQTAADVDALRKQKRVLANARKQDAMKVLGMNAQASDVKYGIDPNTGEYTMYYRNPITGVFEKTK